jgi:diguanylate cyclase (GGDEF)-like protein
VVASHTLFAAKVSVTAPDEVTVENPPENLLPQLLMAGNVAVSLAILALTLSTFRIGARPRHARSWFFFGSACVVLAVDSFVGLISGTVIPPLSSAIRLVFAFLLAVGFVLLYGADRNEIERVEREKAHALELATRDPLTALYNMRAFREIAGKRVLEAFAKGARCAIAILDLDGFKRLNDTQGHPAGDRFLQLVATATRASLRPDDLAARYGGDEFIVFLDRCDAEEAQRVVHRIRESVQNLSAGMKGGVTLSAGVAALPEHGRDLAGLLDAADEVLLEVKRTGKNDVRTVGPRVSPPTAASA